MKITLLLFTGLLFTGLLVPAATAAEETRTVAEIKTSMEEAFPNLKEQELYAGKWTVGEDIKPGRYQLTTNQGDSGNIFVDDETGKGLINDILSNKENSGLGVASITIDLKEGYTIEIKRLDVVFLNPYETKILTSLSAGTWIAGVDIDPGKYTVTTASNQGNLIIDGPDGTAKTMALLSSDITEGVTVALEEGDVIRISNLDVVKFQEQ